MSPFEPLSRAIGQLTDPPMLRTLAQSLALAALSFVALALGASWGLHHALSGHGWWAGLVAALGAVAAVAAAFWLFLPVAVLIAGQFLEPICRAVERRYYPHLPPPSGASLTAATWESLAIALRVLLYNLLGLALALAVPGIGVVIGWAIAAWALGRGLFVAVAMRRMSRTEALRLYDRNRGRVLVQGGVLTILGTLPIANLLLPVLGPSAMVHVVESCG